MRRLLVLLAAVWLANPSWAADVAARYPQARSFFPDATHFGAFEGTPRAAAAWRDAELLGYLVLSNDVVRIPAYSGYPINTLIGLDRQGNIAGLAIVHHDEPILAAGVSEEQLHAFVAQYRGRSALERFSIGAERPGHVTLDGISGATITVMVESATIEKTARALAGSRSLRPAPAANATTARAAAATPPAIEVGRDPSAPPAAEETPIWIAVWLERQFRIAVLLTGLGTLLLLLFFQDWFARRPNLLHRVRTGYLLFTLLFIGWYGLAQLSIVNVFTFLHSMTHGFQWGSFLIDPMMFILWSFVALTLLLWGRGVYCGWLCPFGALQELSFQLGQRLRFPHFEMPAMVHERLWAVKYIILLVLFGISLQSLGAAQLGAEVEPFKTAITLRFDREWYYLLYAGGLVVVGLFNRKFYCKYLCVLGAALTFPARFRIFDWLRRHRECGRPCQICAVECEVQAIKKNGEINANECHHCLDCQVTYWNEQKCPPLVDRRKRRERGARVRELVRGMDDTVGAPGLTPTPNPADCRITDPETCRNCPERCERS